MTKHRRELLTAASTVILLVIAGSSIASLSFRNPFLSREVSGPVTLKQEWMELTPKEPLKAQRDTQELRLFPDPPIKTKDGNGPDFNIEGELIDSNGVTHHSSPGLSENLTGNLTIVSRSLDFKGMPKDVTYKTVRIKSSAPYPVKKILWLCYNWSEVNH